MQIVNKVDRFIAFTYESQLQSVALCIVCLLVYIYHLGEW